MPNHPIFRLVVAATLIVTAGCSTLRTGADHDPWVDFDGYRTFSWIDDDPLVTADPNERPVSPLTQAQISNAILGALERRGYRFQEDRDSADFVVAYTLGTRDKLEVRSYPHPYRGDWDWRPFGRDFASADVYEEAYTEGSLAVDIFDGRTRRPVWHGWATRRIVEADRQDPAPAIRETVDAVIARFPPR